jgi:hypothetical protein
MSELHTTSEKHGYTNLPVGRPERINKIRIGITKEIDMWTTLSRR